MCKLCDERDLAAAGVNLSNAQAVHLLVKAAVSLDDQNLTDARDRVLQALYEILPEKLKAEAGPIPTEAGQPEAAKAPDTVFVPGVGEVDRERAQNIIAKILGVDPRTITLV